VARITASASVVQSELSSLHIATVQDTATTLAGTVLASTAAEDAKGILVIEAKCGIFVADATATATATASAAAAVVIADTGTRKTRDVTINGVGSRTRLVALGIGTCYDRW